MAPRRWLLLGLSLGSLVILSYGAIAVAFSVPVTPGMAAENAPAERAPPEGMRAVVRPIVNPGDVPTLRKDGDPAWLLLADRPSGIPAAAENPRLVQALAYASVLHDRTYAEPVMAFVNLTAAANETGESTFNTTVNVTQLGDGRSGFLVKTASAREVEFVPEADVVGMVEAWESPFWSYGLLGAGSVGFVAPLVALILTARPSGQPGLPTSAARGAARAAGACPECRRPLAADADFCTACGAWASGKGS